MSRALFGEQTETYHAYWNAHHKRRIKQGIKSRMLFNTDTPRSVMKNRNSYKDCDTRYMPTDLRTSSWIFIYGNVCAIFLHSPAQFAIEIRNKEIAQTFRAYFEEYWEKSQPFV